MPDYLKKVGRRIIIYLRGSPLNKRTVVIQPGKMALNILLQKARGLPMTMINKLQVESFRGIRDLSIDRLSQINLIVGDNNCGKTSLLEVIQFLRAPGDLANIYRIARLRETLLTYNANSVYDSFICMFPKDEDVQKIQFSGECDRIPFSYVLSGKQSKKLLDVRELSDTVSYLLFGKRVREMMDVGESPNDVRGEIDEINGETETDVFDGQSVYTNSVFQHKKRLRLNRLSRITGTALKTDEQIRINYVAPFEHLRGSNINKIIKDDQYKEKCLKTLQLFDPDIEDMVIFRSDVFNRPVDYLRHKQLGNMPLSTYGDGIKKVLVLSNAIVESTNGILLIDEFETSIHKQYYDQIFRFLVNACKEFNVQAFVTTHSLEAVDALLNTQDYGTQDANDDITVVTLKHKSDKTYSRVLPGRVVFEDRETFGFEVRL